MKIEANEVEINGVKYVPKDSLPPSVTKDMVLIRSKSAGVFFGQLAETSLAEGWVRLRNARRIWYWDGAASLSQLASDGTAKPSTCKFPAAITEATILEVIEILPCTEKAAASINGVSVWKQ